MKKMNCNINGTVNNATMILGSGFHGEEQKEILPGGGFHGGEQKETLPGGGFH